MQPSVVVIFGLVAILPYKEICSAASLMSNHSITHVVDDGSNSTNTMPLRSFDDTGVRQGEFTSVLRRAPQEKQARPVKTVVAALLTSFAEAFSVLSAVPIVAAISFINRVANVTNHTLHFGGELTKLPLTITNSIIDELSNVTFPN